MSWSAIFLHGTAKKDTTPMVGVQIHYFSGIQLLTVFLTFGIGSEYFFIFFDAYKQSLLEPLVCGSQKSRIDYTCKRAAQVSLSPPWGTLSFSST